jgi:hypothetical protein
MLGVLGVLGVFAVLGASAQAPLAAGQSSLSLQDVMQRVERYVASYGEKASIVVATERYVQRTSGSAVGSAATRTLVSDFAIVNAGANRGWLGFRDVLEVDNRKIADRQERLAHVLMAAQGRYDEATRLSNESARFNIGKVERNFNVPTAALFFFVPENHDRFKFAAKRVDEDGMWEITFREVGQPPLIRTPDGTAIASSGSIWVMPGGTMVRTRLDTELRQTRYGMSERGKGRIDVTYRRIDMLDMWLPASMEESFEAEREGEWQKVAGRADYNDYRAFTTSGRIK